jgi:predicted peroxiredoxin
MQQQREDTNGSRSKRTDLHDYTWDRSRGFFGRLYYRKWRHYGRLKVFIFLSSSGVDLVRKRAADTTQVNPLESLAKLINDFMTRGGTIWACTPCVKSRGYADGDLIDGVVITGASVMHERIKAGAATLSF